MANRDEERIWESIHKSGVPLELEVYRIISSRKEWDANPSQVYIDPDEKKGREVDLVASLEAKDSPSFLSLTLNLVVECKKIPGNAWVFFPIKGLFGVVPTVSAIQMAHMGREAELVKGFDFTGYGPKDVRASRHKHEVVLEREKSNRKGKDPDNIFEAVITVTKATEYLRGKREKEFKDFIVTYAKEVLKPNPDNSFEYSMGAVDAFQPVIVFDGKLYEANIEDESLKSVDHTILVTESRSIAYDVDFLPIIVCTSKYLPHLMDKLEANLESAKERTLEVDKEGTKWSETHRKRVISAVRFMSKTDEG